MFRLVNGYVFMDEGEGGDIGAASTAGDAGASMDSSSEASASADSSSVGGQPSPQPEFSWNDHLDKEMELKINGKEQKVSLAKMKADYQKALAAEERFQQASAKEKQAMSILSSLKDNPAKALQELGIDPYEFSRSQIEQVIRDHEESPEQKELRELRDFKSKQETEVKTREEQRQQMEAEAKHQVTMEQLQTDIISSMEKHKLRRDESSVRAIAGMMHTAFKQGIEMTADHAARLYAQEQKASVSHSLKDLSGDELLAMLGEEVAAKIRQSDLARVKASSKAQQSSAPKSNPLSENIVDPSDLKELNKKLRQELGL